MDNFFNSEEYKNDLMKETKENLVKFIIDLLKLNEESQKTTEMASDDIVELSNYILDLKNSNKQISS